MAYSRLVARVGIVGALGLVLAIACTTNDTQESGGSAGEGGESGGHAGSSTQGGSANKAGSGGSAGKAGGGGTGGGGTGGSANGGKGGTMAGGTGGEAPGGGGAGGTAGGEAGAAGAGGAPEIKTAQCTYGCMKDEDCVGGPVEACDQDTHQCMAPSPQCGADADCMPFLSQWFQNCMGPADCDNGYACVAWEETGYCAVVPIAGPTPCDTGVPTMVPAFTGGGSVSVCASEDPRCFSGTCQPGCNDSSAGGCIPGFGDTCNKTTGKCDCTQGTECNSGKCGKDAQCVQCVTDDDCAPLAAYGQDKCMGGNCGCSAAGVCPDQGFANATVACQ